MGATVTIVGHSAVDLGLQDAYYVVAQFHFAFPLGGYNCNLLDASSEDVGTKHSLLSSSCPLSLSLSLSSRLRWIA